jgi:hypothetical protein
VWGDSPQFLTFSHGVKEFHESFGYRSLVQSPRAHLPDDHKQHKEFN